MLGEQGVGWGEQGVGYWEGGDWCYAALGLD